MEEFELEPGEQIMRVVRVHPFVLFLELLPFAFLAILPLVLAAFYGVYSSVNPMLATALWNMHLPRNVFRFLLGTWYLIAWTGAFSRFTRYYLTSWVITNQRLVDIKQYAFFNREVSSFMLTRVQDITTNVSGVLATFMRFGKLEVQTAGNDEHFRMDGLADPVAVRDIIMRQVALLHGSDTASSAGL